MKIALKKALMTVIPSLTYSSKEQAREAIEIVKDNDIHVYNNLREETVIGVAGGTGVNAPRLYPGEIVIYSLTVGDTEHIFGGIIQDMYFADLAKGTTRGEQLLKEGVEKQWLLVVKRFGAPGLHDIIDQYSTSSKILFIFDGLFGNGHEVKGYNLSFEEIITIMTAGCLDAGSIIKDITGKAIGYRQQVEKAINEVSDSEDPPTFH